MFFVPKNRELGSRKFFATAKTIRDQVLQDTPNTKQKQLSLFVFGAVFLN
jgi:hypothetical protein